MLVIDRFEGKIAVLEADDETLDIPVKYLPDDAREGDVIRLIIDNKQTESRKKRIEKLADSIFE